MDRVLLHRQESPQPGTCEEVHSIHHLPEGQVKSAKMEAYPALIPNKRGWELLNKTDLAEARRQGMVLGQRNVMDDIREGRIQYRALPVQQSLEDWNDFWSQYKGA